MITTKTITVTILALLLTFLSSYSHSYEVSTHGALVREAYSQSTLPDKQETVPVGPPSIKSGVLTRLGFSGSSNLGNFYIDMSPSDGSATVRFNNYGFGGGTGDVDYTQNKFKAANKRLDNPNSITIQSPEGWLMVGSIREDDVAYDKGVDKEENSPQDDPQGAFTRVYNHFYDPYQNGRPMQGGPISGVAAPDWAIDGKGLLGKENRFSIKNAREALFRATTLRTLVNGQLQPLDPPSPPWGSGISALNLTSDQDIAMAYWATVFRALGDAAHLLEDMAQPQHTRNDWHAGSGCIVSDNACIAGQASFYEKYIEAKVTGAPSFKLTTQQRPGQPTKGEDIMLSPDLPAPNYDANLPYPIPRFNGFMNYYTGGINNDSYTATGLANYSNMGFYSAGTNLNTVTHHALPPNSLDDPISPTKLTLSALTGDVRDIHGDLVPIDDSTPLALLLYPVKDNLTGETAPNVRLSSYSVFDKFLLNKGKEPVYSLNHYNYDAQADLLLPRAVAYTAGLIDYFFRGNMEISLPEEGIYGLVDHGNFAPPNKTDPIQDFKGFNKIKLKLKNTSGFTDGLGTPHYQDAMGEGVLVASIWFYRNKDYTDNLDGELPAGATEADYLAKRTTEMEVVTSDPLDLNSLAFGEEAEFTFNFSPDPSTGLPRELPINAWEPKLFVTFRGKFGDEADAVVVSEKQISSPVFFTVFNRIDLLSYFGTCYTEDQINADLALWSSLRAECNTLSSVYGTLAGACKNLGINAWVFFGDLDQSIGDGMVRVHWWAAPNMHTFTTGLWWFEGGLLTPNFGRLAFLVDDKKTSLITDAYNWDLGGLASTRNNLPLKGNSSAADRYKTIDYENKVTEKYFRFNNYRGVKFYDGAYYVLNANPSGISDSYPPSIGCPNGYLGGTADPALPNFVGDQERYPVPATTITGW